MVMYNKRHCKVAKRLPNSLGTLDYFHNCTLSILTFSVPQCKCFELLDPYCLFAHTKDRTRDDTTLTHS